MSNLPAVAFIKSSTAASLPSPPFLATCCCFLSLPVRLWCRAISSPDLLPGRSAGVVLCKVQSAKVCCITSATSALLHRLEHMSNQFGRGRRNWKLRVSRAKPHLSPMGRCGRSGFGCLIPCWQHSPVLKSKLGQDSHAHTCMTQKKAVTTGFCEIPWPGSEKT